MEATAIATDSESLKAIGGQAGIRLQHFRIATGSDAAVHAALRVAIARGDLHAAAADPTFQCLDRLLGILWRLTHDSGQQVSRAAAGTIPSSSAAASPSAGPRAARDR